LHILPRLSPIKEADEAEADQQSSGGEEEQRVGIPIRVTVDEGITALISQVHPHETNESEDEAKDIEVIGKQQNPVRVLEEEGNGEDQNNQPDEWDRSASNSPIHGWKEKAEADRNKSKITSKKPSSA
jgi:hypothetical protein